MIILLDGGKNVFDMRSIQTRVFDTTNKNKIMREIIAFIQDIYFDIDVMDAVEVLEVYQTFFKLLGI